MAANNEITLETERCIFVDDHIYFSNYYLKSKITDANVSVNKINFDRTEFMNTTMIQDENKKTVQNTVVITLPDISALNESLYSKVKLSDKTIDINIAENEILELKILELKIFKDIDQIRQFLQFAGWWCSEAQHTDFDNRVKPAQTDLVPSEPSQPAATGSQTAPAEPGWFSNLLPSWGQQPAQPSAQQSGQPSAPQSGQPSVQPLGQQSAPQIGGGTKQTRSTRNHKNRKSKKN
jgi:hypothetical protein